MKIEFYNINGGDFNRNRQMGGGRWTCVPECPYGKILCGKCILQKFERVDWATDKIHEISEIIVDAGKVLFLDKEEYDKIL